MEKKDTSLLVNFELLYLVHGTNILKKKKENNYIDWAEFRQDCSARRKCIKTIKKSVSYTFRMICQ